MVNKSIGTEESILNAAKLVFHRKGYEGTRMQEIADEAGINKSLLHYYFRNKENLFEAVFEAAFTSIMKRVFEIFSGDTPFEEKIQLFCDHYITFIQQNSYVPWFIINGLYEKPDQIRKIFSKLNFKPGYLLSSIGNQVKMDYKIEIDPIQLYINILSLSVFPVVAKPLIEEVFGLHGEDLDKFYEQRKTEVPEFVLNSLREKMKTNPKK